jgi:hypothetical protein
VTSGENISSDGCEEIVVAGICWSTSHNPIPADNKTSDGTGTGSFTSNITGLTPGTTYYLRAYATNSIGTAYGDEISFKTLSDVSSGQIIADHRIVADYNKIPAYYMNEVKKMWFVIPGESHSYAYTDGLSILRNANANYAVTVTSSGTPEAYTTSHIRAGRASWGDVDNSSGCIYSYGEEDWFTNATAVARTKAGISYCNSHGLTITAIGFGWCTDMFVGTPSATADPVYGCHWSGASKNGPEGDRCWGLDATDNTITGNSICLDTYLSVTQQYIDYCTANNIPTKVFFTTGPIDGWVGGYTPEKSYVTYLKHQRIRDYVKANASRILFDYADILCYNDDGSTNTDTWNGHTFQKGTDNNVYPEYTGHISFAGGLRLGKALWWMLARMAGWDGN